MPYKDPEKRREAGRKASLKYIAKNRDICSARTLEWKKANLGKNRASARRDYHKHREKRRAKNDEYRAIRRDEINAAARAARATDPERFKGYYTKVPPERIRFYSSRRRAIRLMQACVCCTAAQIEELHSCAALVGGEVDHRIPLVLGGHDCMKNLQVLTLEDHREKTKSDLRYIAYAKRRSKLLLQWPVAAAA